MILNKESEHSNQSLLKNLKFRKGKTSREYYQKKDIDNVEYFFGMSKGFLSGTNVKQIKSILKIKREAFIREFSSFQEPDSRMQDQIADYKKFVNELCN